MRIQDLPGLSAVERLKAELSDPGRDPQIVRAEAEAMVKAKVDGDPIWAQMTDLAEKPPARMLAYSDRVAAKKKEMKDNLFPGWADQERNRFAESLRSDNEQFAQLAEKARSTFSVSLLAVPLTAVDALSLSHRMQLLYWADPADAEALVEDGIMRSDRAFLDGAKINIRSWAGSRNVWSSPEGRRVAQRILARIEFAAPNMTQMESAYAGDRMEATLRAWKYLLTQILNADGDPEPVRVHRQTGSFAPLLEPVQK